jgi:hypothetical protein
MDARELGATPDEIQQYGAALSFWDALRLLQKYSPLVNYARAFVGEVDPYKKSLIVADACEWVAQQTDAQLDNQLVRKISDVLRTKEGEELVRFCLFQVGVK